MMEIYFGKKTKIWVLFLSPFLWAIHFQLVYVAAAIACAKNPQSLGTVRIFTGGLTLIIVLVLAREIFLSWGKHTLGESNPPHDAPTPHDRERFLGLARLLISTLSLLAVLYTTYVIFFFGSCR